MIKKPIKLITYIFLWRASENSALEGTY